MNFKKLLSFCLAAIVVISLIACESDSEKTPDKTIIKLNEMSLDDIIAKAKEEKEIQSVGMPDTWANWVETWQDFENEYGIKHQDTDMSSAEELALFEAEKESPTKDIGDVGRAFGPIAVDKGLTLAYKTSYYDEIPNWAKDKEGHWMISYTGTISIISNKNKVKNSPKSFKDLLTGDYKVTIGDVNAATQAQNVVLSCAIANGGDESNLKPGLDFLAKLAEQGRLDLGDASIARLESGEIEVGLFWDFNALNYKDKIIEENPSLDFEIVIPSDGSIQSGYTTVINKYAPHPYAAALAREFILSDEGQINLARGYARPIRDKIELPSEIQEKLLPKEMYKNTYQIKNAAAWDKSAKNLGELWQDEVLSKIKN